MFNKFMKTLSNMHKGEKGMTGLETAIILIAFITVAAVFGYAVLSAGLFSSERAKETVYAGLNEAKSAMEISGSVMGLGDNVTPNAHGNKVHIEECYYVRQPCRHDRVQWH